MQKIIILLCTIILVSCHRTSTDTSDSMPSLYGEPRIIPFKPNGYNVNPFSGDSIPLVINEAGDTIKTGVEVPVPGWTNNDESLSLPKTGSMKATKQITFSERVNYVPRHLKSSLVDETQLKKFVIGKDTSSHVLKNDYGDTIPSNTPTTLSGKVNRIKSPMPVLAGLPRMRDNVKYDLQNLGLRDGMISEIANTIFMDNHNYLWIGTWVGLSQYDGTNFYHYGLDEGFVNIPVSAITQDTFGHLWIATFGNGVYCFNGQEFIRYAFREGLANDVIYHLIKDKTGNIWVASQRGFFKLVPGGNGKMCQVTYYSRKEGLLHSKVNYLIQDKKGILWLGTGRGLQSFDPVHGIFTNYRDIDGFPTSAGALLEDSKGNLWIQCEEGLYRYTLPTNTVQGKITHFTKSEGFTDQPSFRFLEDHAHNIWIATPGDGLYRYTAEMEHDSLIESFTHFNQDVGLWGDKIPCLFEDKANNLWIGTTNNGMYRLSPNSFRLYSNESIVPRDIEDILLSGTDQMYLATYTEGVYELNLPSVHQKGSLTQYKMDPAMFNATGEQAFFVNQISGIVKDTSGNIFYLTSKGLVAQNRKTGKDNNLVYFGYQQGFPTSFGLFLDRPIGIDANGNVWISVYGDGLAEFEYENDLSKGRFTYYNIHRSGLADNYCTNILEDADGSLWVGSEHGIIHITSVSAGHEATMTYISEREGLSSNYARPRYLDKNGFLWIATDDGGVSIFKPGKEREESYFIYLTKTEGLSDINVLDIVGTTQQNGEEMFWVSTAKGIDLFIFNPGQKTPRKVGFLDIQDGIHNLPVKHLMNDHESHLIGVSSKGIESIALKTFELANTPPNPKLHDIDINGTSVDYRNPEEVLNRGIEFDSAIHFENYPHRLALSYKNNHLTFHFSAIDWHAPYKIKYSYRIEGLNEDWSPPSSEAKAEYRNLPSGTHTFKVRAIGESQQWSDPFEYTFTIRPPWWYSWWAFVMYSCFGGFILYRTYRFQLDRKLEMAERQKLIELDRVKNRLYTNITHEFRTPLTLIHGPVTQALSKNETLDKKDIQSIHRQSERLQELINQMLELQKLEAGMLKPNYAYGEIIQMLRYLFSSFETWASEKNISMLFSSSLQEVYMDFDKEKLTQIITNLVNNAIKHTPRNGKVAISVNASPSGEFLVIQVSDTGGGISEEDLPYIFDRFYQSKRAAVGGTGIGLAIVKNLTELLGGSISVESKPDAGSTFKLTLPITKHAPKVIEVPNALVSKIQDTDDEETHFSISDQTFPGKPIVLIIEDHPEVSQYIVSCLAHDYNILTAMNGDEGLQVALEKVPDLIISDVMMPGKDGFELTRLLKKDIQTSHIPIILLTGRGDHDAMMAGIEQGADAYVVKPFDPAELELRVKKLLELRTNLSLYYRQHATTREVEHTIHTSVKENEFLKNMRIFIEEHINDPQFNMDMLSHHMAMSHPQLHRKITALTGESVGKFVRSIRLTKAKDLLKNSDMTVSEIAYETGFSEPGYFTKVFSREYHVSPSEYRANPF